VDRARAASDAVLVLDAGDLLLPPASPIPGALPPDAGEVERRAQLLAAAFARMGITAFSPGERDLAVGPALLRRVLAAAKVPAVSANLFDRRGKRLFPADRIVDAAGVKVGVFGLTRMLPENAEAWKAWGVEARDAAAAAREEVAALRARGADVVVALLHLGPKPDAKKLLEDVPGIDWAVLGHSQANLELPEAAGRARMIEAMSQGKQVGRLDLHVLGGGFDFADAGERSQMEAILADHRRQLDDYGKRLAETKQPAMRQFYEARKVEIEKSIGRESTIVAALPAEVKGSWFENRVLPLDASIPDQAGVALLVAAYNHENQRRAEAGKPVGVAERDPRAAAPPAPAAHLLKAAAGTTAPAPATMSYAGTAACGACHQPALRFWQTTKHAHALESLARKKRDHDPTCVGCHVTGYLRPGGTADLAVAITRLRDVGCETCHGPGLAHVTAEGKNKKTSVARQVPASVCLGCHTPDQTNGEFDYPAFMKAVLGPGHGGHATQ
jgi:hypothetical protein